MAAKKRKTQNPPVSTNPEIRQLKESVLELQEFVLELKNILDDVVSNPGPALAGRHHKRLSEAWKDATQSETQSTDRLSKYVSGLNGTPEKSQVIIDQELMDAGLTGAPLKLKLGVYQHARDIYLDHGTAKQMQSAPKSLLAKWRKAFCKVLQTGNIILGSTASIIPGGEYFKELVEEVQLIAEMTGDIEELS